MIELDFEDVGKIPEEGIYTVRVADVEVKETQNKPENQNLVFQYKIVEPEEWMEFPIWDNVSLTPQARWRLQIVLEAITGEDWKENSMALDPRDLLGREFQVSLFHSTYQGRKSAKVKDYFNEKREDELMAGFSTSSDSGSDQLKFDSEEEPF